MSFRPPVTRTCWRCRRQLPEIDSPEMLAEYRKLADEAEALAAMVAASRAGA